MQFYLLLLARFRCWCWGWGWCWWWCALPNTQITAKHFYIALNATKKTPPKSRPQIPPLSLSLSLIHSLPLFFLLLFPSLPIAFSISYHSPTNAPTISICAYLSLSHVTHRQNSLRGDLAVEGGVALRNSIPFQQKASSFPYEDKPDRLSAKEASFLLNGEEILRLSPPSSKELCAISLSLSCMIVLAFLSLSLSHL